MIRPDLFAQLCIDNGFNCVQMNDPCRLQIWDEYAGLVLSGNQLPFMNVENLLTFIVQLHEQGWCQKTQTHIHQVQENPAVVVDDKEFGSLSAFRLLIVKQSQIPLKLPLDLEQKPFFYEHTFSNPVHDYGEDFVEFAIENYNWKMQRLMLGQPGWLSVKIIDWLEKTYPTKLQFHQLHNKNLEWVGIADTLKKLKQQYSNYSGHLNA